MLLGLLAGVIVTMPAWAWVFAHLNIGWTFVEEGTAKIVMLGANFYRVLPQMAGHVVNKKTWEIEEGSIHPLNPLGWIALWFGGGIVGAKWVGIPPFFSIHNYSFRWATVVREAGTAGQVSDRPLHREKEVDQIFLKDAVYYGKIVEAETSEKLPVDVEYLLTVRIVNPYKALFKVHRWLDATLDLVAQRGRQYIGTKTYADLISKEEDKVSVGFSGGVAKLKKQLKKEYGVLFVRADILSVGFSGTAREEYQRASTASYTAEAKAVAVEREARAKALATKVQGQAEAEAIKARNEAFADNPVAAQAILNAEVGKAQSIGSIAGAILSHWVGGNKP